MCRELTSSSGVFFQYASSCVSTSRKKSRPPTLRRADADTELRNELGCNDARVVTGLEGWTGVHVTGRSELDYVYTRGALHSGRN